jgi:hypothetical protein
MENTLGGTCFELEFFGEQVGAAVRGLGHKTQRSAAAFVIRAPCLNGR